MRMSERRFRALVENSSDAIKLVSRDGLILYASPATARILGYAVEEQLGQSVFELVHPDDLADVRASFAETLAQPGRPIYSRTRRRHRDGSWRHLDVVRVNWLDDPAISAIVTNYRDVSDRVSLEEQFQKSQRLEAVGRLAGGVAHDFNNLLTVILSYSRMAIDDLREDEPVREYMHEIHKAADRAATLTQQLLAFSRRQVLAPRVVNLNGIVRDMQNILQRVIGEDIELVVELAGSLAHCKLDAGQVEQVIVNLAVNARDAMPTGGRLMLETADVEITPEYGRRHVGVEPGKYVMLVISDTGVGMTSQTRERIFEPFFTTKESGKGTGLGLATVFGIVKQSGGHIWVHSEPGHGTTFRLYFPHTEERPSVQPVSSLPPTSIAGDEVVLLAEDEPAVREIARKILERAGYTVLEASNGGEALLIVEQHPGPIHVLLTDVIMPRMSGQALAQRLLQVRPELKVLYMSGYTDDAIGHHGVLPPGTEFLQKPLTPELLLRRMRQVLGA
jgi:PAS domain S-box-containing protein